MPRKNKSFLGRRSGALDVQGEVCLDNPGVVIDRMTRREGVLRAPRLRPVQLRGPIPGVRSHALRASVTDMVYVQTADPRRVFEANVDGSESRALMSLPGDLGSSFAVSPDGKRIRFATADSKMWESNLDGSGMHRLFPEHNERFCCGRWSPDGRLFLFASEDRGRANLWALMETGYGPRPKPVKLTNGPIEFRLSTVSRDGKQIFAVGDNQRGELSVYDASSGLFRPYLNGISAGFVNYSRDGRSGKCSMQGGWFAGGGGVIRR